MALKTSPRHPVGSIPGKEFVDTGEPFGLKIGIINRVDEVNMKADVRILTGGGTRLEIDLTQAMAGPRSFWGGVPELNSLVIIGYRRKHKNLYEAMILGYLPVANRIGLRFDPLSPTDPSEIEADDLADAPGVLGPTYRRKRLKMKLGNVGGMSAEGSELVMDEDVRMVNRAGDLFELRDAERALVSQSVHRFESSSGIRST